MAPPRPALELPVEPIPGLDHDDIREAAYELFFTSCRSSPGFGGRNALSYYPSAAAAQEGAGEGDIGGNGRVGLMGTSRLKRLLGLKATKKLTSTSSSLTWGPNSNRLSNPDSPRGGTPRLTSSGGGSVLSPRKGAGAGFRYANTAPAGLAWRVKRPMTSAEIMRQQMKVSEQNETRLRKTLMRALVGQMGRKAETVILPLELLRHLKPSEFSFPAEYHVWQKRQLNLLEEGLLLHPSIPLNKSNAHAMQLRDIIRASEIKPIDTANNSETMITLSNCVISLSWRSNHGGPDEVCHWADGYPLNIHLYLALLHSIFDLKDETLVLDEVDELLELMKKMWSTLGINKMIHTVCFTWTLFKQYVVTAETEPDLLFACLTMLSEVSNDAKRADREVAYVKILSSVLSSMQSWFEKRLLDYHENFRKEDSGYMENILAMALSTTKILEEDVLRVGIIKDPTTNRVDYYIKSSLKAAFTKILENGAAEEDTSASLLKLAKEIEELAVKEKENYSHILENWHPVASGVAAVTLHGCFGVILNRYLSGMPTLTNETVRVLEGAGKLEKFLVQMVVEDSNECEDGGKAIVQEMAPYEVDSIVSGMMKNWISERLKEGREYLNKAKDTEGWNPRSKLQPYAQSAVGLMSFAKEAVEDFLEINVTDPEDFIQGLADGLEILIQDYMCFVEMCGSKQTYKPTLPPLTRCNREPRLRKLWSRASPCRAGGEHFLRNDAANGVHARPSTSRGTQRLYVRINTLHYILSQLHGVEKLLSLAPRQAPPFLSNRQTSKGRSIAPSESYFDRVRSSIQAAIQHVSEVAAYRLIFLDSGFVFYDGMYKGGVVCSRVRPALRTLKQNLTLLVAILTDRAQPLAVKEVMKATFEAFLMILLAGGNNRMFTRSDHDMIEDDFRSLKRVFCTCGEGLVAEDVVENEADAVEGIIALMGKSTEQLVEDFSILACEASGMGFVGEGQRLPMPPTSGRWSRADPNTLLRVLCHRNDGLANRFLKHNFQLAKRK